MQKREKVQQSYLSDNSFFKKEAMFLYDFNSLQIIDANEQALIRYGYSKKELTNMKLSDLGNKVSLSDLNIKNVSFTNIYPQELWQHSNKLGERWYIQFTFQKFRHNSRLVRMAIAHDINEIVTQESLDLRNMPRVDLMRTQMPFALIEWDKDLKVRDFSEKSELMFDAQYHDVLGKPIEELSFIDEPAIFELRDQLNNNDTGYFTFTSEHTNSRGDQMVSHWHNSIIKNDKGSVIAIYSLIEDITIQQLSEDKLRKSESKFRIMSEQSFVGIYILSGTRFSYVNPRMCDLTGYSEKELKENMHIYDLIHPDDFSWINRQRKQWEREGRDSFETNLRILTKSDRILHVKTYGSAIRNGGSQKILGVIIDQTNQVKTLQKYRSSVESYQSLFNSISDSIYIQDEHGTFLEVNEGVLDMYGYEKEEIIGENPSFLAAESKVDLNETMERFQKALEGESQDFRWWGKRKNGEIFPKEIRLSKGQFFGQDVVIAVARDISETVKREEDLRRNEELFEQLFSNSPLGIALLDRESLIMQVNRSFESLFGFSNDDAKGENIDDLIVPKDDLERARKLSDSTETFTLTKKRRTRSGELIDVFIYGVPVVLEGEPIAMFGIYMDITDRIESEERLKQSLEEKKVLLSEIHHRVKNNLAVITGLLELQYHNLKSEEARNALRDSQMRINSMGLIHEKLYQNETLSEIDFGQYISELVGVIVKSHNKTDEEINIKMDAVPIKLPIKKAIPCGLVINEIITNSLKYAFPEGHPDPEIRIVFKRHDGRATIEISDNGIGLPEPFEELDTNSLGTLLIKTLTSQLKADLQVKSTKGTKYIFSFDLTKE